MITGKGKPPDVPREGPGLSNGTALTWVTSGLPPGGRERGEGECIKWQRRLSLESEGRGKKCGVGLCAEVSASRLGDCPWLPAGADTLINKPSRPWTKLAEVQLYASDLCASLQVNYTSRENI